MKESDLQSEFKKYLTVMSLTHPPIRRMNENKANVLVVSRRKHLIGKGIIAGIPVTGQIREEGRRTA
jgi:hypothetical protein